jgi:peroxisomal membrane protein 4
LLQKKINGGKERNVDTFIAGLIGGYIVFGERNAVNEQVDHFFHQTKKFMAC